MLKSLFKPSPSKFGPGVPLLWRGNSLAVLNSFFKKLLSLQKESIDTVDDEVFLFESARSAIYNCLLSEGVGAGDEVVISSFTCEAVTYAIARTGARAVYVDVNDDLTMCDGDVIDAIGPLTKAVILQNTFGRLGLQLKTIEAIRSRGLFILEDCALSIGSKIDDSPLGSFGDVSVWSLEVSKTVTIGWGGVATANKKESHKALAKRYQQLGQVSHISDIRRLFQLWFSILMMTARVPGAIFIWYFMYGTRIFRRSNSFGEQHASKHEKLGVLSRSMFSHIKPLLGNIFDKTNSNYKLLLSEASSLGLNCPVIEQDDEFVVSPRISLLVAEQHISDIIRQGDKVGVEVGRWFSECPPKWGLENAKVYSSSNTERISKLIINLPCHWTLTPEELGQIKSIITYISSLK
ncbi:MAG: DegT/DnrJ/EryC1/StrS family aminotransferase [Colwellia sp.]|jgi:Predicted pyridoxal phosphate-dependent enzyme apparently involved in regulation of cell wall biogenesis